MKNVVIIGGGIIGLSTAYYLVKDGHKVTVIDQSDMTSGSSFVNAGYITPSHFIPLAAPGIISKGIKYMFDKTSPFYMKPRLDLDFFKWTWNFKKSATKSKVEKAIPVLKDINILSRELYKEIKQSSDFNFSFDQKGLLMCYKTDKAGEEEMAVAKLAVDQGLNAQNLSLKEIEKLEPNVQLDVKGAVFYDCDAHMTPEEYMGELLSFLKSNGVVFYTNEKVVDLELKQNKVSKVITDKRSLNTDEIVVSAGSWSPIVTKKLGLKIPIQAGKGYRINVNRETGISIPAILSEAKVAVTPMNGFTRFAGTMEIGGINHNINPIRVKTIANAAEDYYKKLKFEKLELDAAACGLRPCTPDGLPYIGRPLNYKNIIVATGHAMMGWSLGPATGKLVSEVISEQKISLDLSPFHPNRKF